MPTKHVAGFSGGIDSQALANWLLLRYDTADVILLNTQAGRNEHPLTVGFVNWFSENVHPVIEVVPLIRDLADVGTKDGFKPKERRQEFSEDDELTFDRLAYIKDRFPSRKAQFCTEYLKLQPQRRWIEENLYANGVDVIRYTGVRKDESAARRDTPESVHDTYYDCELRYPIRDWSKQHCFQFCLGMGQEINPLYSLGFSRVGCAPCVNNSKADIRAWALRYPAMIDKVREWERRVGRTFFPPVVTGKKGRKGQGLMNFIDEVVAWAMTEHGGKVPLANLDEERAQAEAGACSSKYGLCE